MQPDARRGDEDLSKLRTCGPSTSCSLLAPVPANATASAGHTRSPACPHLFILADLTSAQARHLPNLQETAGEKGLSLLGSPPCLLLQPSPLPSAFLALKAPLMHFMLRAGLRQTTAMKVGGDGSPHAGSSASDSVPDSDSRLALPDVYDASLIDEARRLVRQQKEE